MDDALELGIVGNILVIQKIRFNGTIIRFIIMVLSVQRLMERTLRQVILTRHLFPSRRLCQYFEVHYYGPFRPETHGKDTKECRALILKQFLGLGLEPTALRTS